MGKAKTQAERLRIKRGRPIKMDVARTDTGRISRAQHPGEAPDKLAKRARVRMYGVKMKDAATAEAATVIGRLSLAGQHNEGISRDQYEALIEYRDARERYFKAIMAPDSLAVSSGAGGLPDSDDADMRIRAKNRYMGARDAIMACQLDYPISNLFAAVDYLVIRDELHSHMIGDLRLVGNALHRHFFGLDGRRKAG